MRYALIIPALALTLAGCDSPSLQGIFPVAQPAPVAVQTPVVVLPPAQPAPPAAARTVDEFDTTTDEQRRQALDAASFMDDETRLGQTTAALGAPTEAGIWIKTPLVSAVKEGRVEVVGSGKSAVVELRPSGGAAGSGSQISLAAMRLLEVPLTDLPELIIYAR